MNKNKGKYIVGSVDDIARGKGWFFGHFMENELLTSDLVDVSWQHYPAPKPPDPSHYHRDSVEINIVIKGSITCSINGNHIVAHAGDFYILWPETVMANFVTAPETDVIVIRAPSIENGGKVIMDTA